jgi:hypothetical protein
MSQWYYIRWKQLNTGHVYYFNCYSTQFKELVNSPHELDLYIRMWKVFPGLQDQILVISKHIKNDNQNIHFALFNIDKSIESKQYIEIHKNNLDDLDKEIIYQYNDGG